MNTHFLFSLLFLTFLSLCSAASVVFIDNPKGDYFFRSHKSHEFGLSQEDIPSVTAALLGINPPSPIDPSVSQNLNNLIAPNLFKRPRGIFSLNIAALSSDILKNGSELSSAGFPFSQEKTISDAETKTSLSESLIKSVSLFSKNVNNDVEVTSIECSAKCSASCIDQELEALAALLEHSYESSIVEGQGKLTITANDKTQITYDLSIDADRTFASELACLYHAVQDQTNTHVDDIYEPPELILGTITGIQTLKGHYGASDKTSLAGSVLLNVIIRSLDLLQEAYHDRLATSLVFLEDIDLVKFQKVTPKHKRTIRILDDTTEETIAAEYITQFLLIFSGLLLVVVTILSTYALFSMPVTRDSLIYSSVKLD